MKKIEISGHNFWSEERPRWWHYLQFGALVALGTFVLVAMLVPILLIIGDMTLRIANKRPVPKAIPVIDISRR